MSQTGRVVTVVASSATHVAVFAPVLAELEHRGVSTRLVSLDPWYQRGVAQAALKAGLAVHPIEAGRQSQRPFYRRPALAIWGDVLRARAPLGQAIGGSALLMVGNDSGLLEKLALKQARNRAIPSVLVQDGRLAERPSKPPTWTIALNRLARRLMSPVIGAIGFEYLAASAYGAGGTDLIVANGASGARILRNRAGRRTKVVVGGQPRYDYLLGRSHGGNPGGPAVMFTTPFEADALGVDAQRAQEEFALASSVALRTLGVRLIIKPHPREDASPYVRLVGSEHVSDAQPADLLEAACAAVMGISSVAEEAGILGCPVFVVGDVVHRGRFEAILPDADVYPRFEDAKRLASAIARMTDPSNRLALVRRQAGVVSADIAFDRNRTSASVVTDFAVQLLERT